MTSFFLIAHHSQLVTFYFLAFRFMDIQQHITNLKHRDSAIRREAIIAVARAREIRALPLLTRISTEDPSPPLRELAQRAIYHIQPPTESAPPPLADPLRLDEAERLLAQAQHAYQTQGAQAALSLLRQALMLDPSLREDPDAQRIASHALNLPAKHALDTLLNRDTARTVWVSRRRRKTRAYLYALMTLSAVAVAMFILSGSWQWYFTAFQSQSWRDKVQTLDGTEYHVFVPNRPEPAAGWGMLVILHGYGGRAEDLLPYFVTEAERAGVLLVAPTFGEYPADKTLTTARLDEIIVQLRNQYRTDPRGAVLFGFSAGGMVATSYARDYFNVAGVSAVAAPELFIPPGDASNIPYVISYGANDSLVTYNRPVVDSIMANGNPVDFRIIPNLGHSINPTQIELTMNLVQEVYGE